MVQTITLPRVVVTRSAAQDVVRRASLSVGDDAVKVLARGVASSAQSFADELVQQLISRGFHTMILLGAPRQLMADVGASAGRAGTLKVVTDTSDLIAS
ncbi:hypothetical protein [Microbacterium testaceum]|uniref:hypothetical protein n=1 Tax=Microbacterium testaceum TaxID=2033 RepID=UPI000CD01897|nr:hypothetical protein [Microbacterium testaceum]